MKTLFDAKEYRPILRLYIPYWNMDQVVHDTVRYCAGTGIRDLLLFTDAQYIVWNQLSKTEIPRECDILTRATAFFREHGFRSIGINSSLMQMQSTADHRQHEDYDSWLTYADGVTDYRLPCPLDPKLMDYIDFFYGKLAATGADYIYMDDDLRYMYNGIKDTLGCFCPLHLEQFSTRSGHEWNAKALHDAILNRPEIRREWLTFLGESINRIAARIHEAVRRVSREVRAGLMVPCVHGVPMSGSKLTDTVRAISGKDTPLLRPCIGPYQDYDRKMVSAGVFHLEITRQLFGGKAEYTPELETSPSTSVSKSATVSRFYIVQGILNRMPAPLFTPVGYCGDSPFLEPKYREMFRRSLPFFRKLTQLAPDPECRKGVRLFSDLTAAFAYDEKINRVDNLYFPSCSVHNVLDSAGLPHTYGESEVALLCGIHAAPLSEQEIRKRLSLGLILDASAAEILLKKGFGPELGLQGIEVFHHSGSEKAVSQEIFGNYTGSFLQTRIAPKGTIYKLEACPDAEEITQLCDHELRRIAPGVVRYVNKRGGKIAVLPYAINENCLGSTAFHLFCRQRQRMFHALVNWMASDLLLLEFEPAAEVVVQQWQEPDRIVLAITNYAFDMPTFYPVRTALPLERAWCLADTGKLRKLRFANGCLKEKLQPFRPLLIFLEC